MRAFLVTMLVLIALAIGALVISGPAMVDRLGLGGGDDDGAEVRTAVVARGSVVETVSAPGEVEPVTKVDISAEVSARIESLPLREGDRVSRNDVVVKLDDRDLRAALEAVTAQRDRQRATLRAEEARLAGPRARLELALAGLERQTRLYESGDVSLTAVEQADEQVKNLRSELDAAAHSISAIEASLVGADADIARAQEALKRTEIRSPIDGVITILNAEVGELVVVGTMNSPGTVILTVADLTRMRLVASVAESDIARVETGQSAEIFVNAYRDESFTGRVTRVALQRSLDSTGTGYFSTEIEIDLEEGRRILSGLAANVDIRIRDHEQLIVPSQAVVERLVDDLPQEIRESSDALDLTKTACAVVYRVVEGKAVCTPVRTGPSSLVETTVLVGLDEGDVVIEGPYKVLEGIRHGDAVRDADSPESAADDSSPDDDAVTAATDGAGG